MKANYGTRVLSVILVTVMLFSCWVFTAPTANAATTTYDVKITINTVSANNCKAAYQGLEKTKKDSAGVSIEYTSNNGMGTTYEKKWDIGNKSLAYINNSGSHTLTGTVSGFPTKLGGYVCDDLFAGIGTPSGFQIQKLEVKGSGQTSYVTLWQGTMQFKSRVNGYGGWIRYDGHTYGWDHGMKNADEGSKGDDDNYINTNDKVGWEAKMPYRKSGGAVSFDPASITLDGTTKTSTASVEAATDQYGVTYSTDNLTTAMSTPSYNASYVTYAASTKKVTATANAHILNEGVNSQSVSVTATFATKNTTNTAAKTTTSKTLTITDEKYDVTVNYKTSNTSDYNSPNSVSEKKSVFYGDKLNYTPSAYDTNAYSYTFNAWTPALAQITGTGQSYTATYTSSSYKYAITFSKGTGNDFGTSYNLSDKLWSYKITSVPSPTKQADATYTYAFDYWLDENNVQTQSSDILNKTISQLGSIGAKSYNKQAKTYTAHFTPTYIDYTMTFLDEDGTQLSTADYHWDGKVTAQADPTKQQDSQYTYTFAGWIVDGDEAQVVTSESITGKTVEQLGGAHTYTAKYTPHLRSYDIKFDSADLNNKDDSTKTQTETLTVEYGSTPNPTTPATIDTKLWTRTFTGWDKEIASVTGPATYIAQYNTVHKVYTLQFLDDDGSVLASPTYHWDQKVTAQADPVKQDNAQYTYTFAGWIVDGDENNVIPGSAITGNTIEQLSANGYDNHTYTAKYTGIINTYTITYLKSNGSEYRVVENVEYGTVPSSLSGDDAVPELIVQPSNDSGHYTAAWDNNVDAGIVGNTTFRIVDTLNKHIWESEEGTITVPATCTEKGTKILKCSVCAHEVPFETDIDPDNHDWGDVLSHDADDNTTGYTYFQCSRCDLYCSTKYENNATVPDESKTADNIEDKIIADNANAKIANPIFNYAGENGEQLFYNRNYSIRPAALRIEKAGVTTQALRFCANVKVPEGVAAALEGDDNNIVDFGFVYTQDDIIEGDPSQLVIYKTKAEQTEHQIYYNSIVDSRLGKKMADGTTVMTKANFADWEGKSIWQRGEDWYITFNLVINVKDKLDENGVSNWSKEYACRPYITYKYHGVTQTVYDEGASAYMDDMEKYSHNSVEYIADCIMAEEAGERTETQLALLKRDKTYCMDRDLCKYYIMGGWSSWAAAGKPESYYDASPEVQKNFLHSYLTYILAEDLELEG